MALLHVFCFWYSVRLGSIIIGVFTLVQSAAWLVLTAMALENLEEASKLLGAALDILRVENDYVSDVVDDPTLCLSLGVAYFSCLLFSCILLIIGAFKCKYFLMYPFTVMYSFYVIILTLGHLILMFYCKDEVERTREGLVPLILYSTLGAFILVYYIYMWVCVISFIQVIKELISDIEIKVQVNDIIAKHEERIKTQKIPLPYSFKY